MAKQPTYKYNNLTKNQQDCLTLIESLGIYELRALARVFGGNSPTTLKRNDHISIVMDKIISGEELRPLPLRQGRPYKELSNIDGILTEISQLAGKDYTMQISKQPSKHIQKMVTFRQTEENVIKQKLFPIEVRGILNERNDKELFFINQDNGKKILVKKDLDARLKPYDYIVGTAVVMNEDNEYILDSIKALNFQNYKTYTDLYNGYESSVPNQKLKLNEKEILLGSRFLLKQSKFLDEADKVSNLVSTLKSNKIITLALIPNVMHEDILTINSLGFNNALLLKYDDNLFATYEIVSTFIEHVKNLQQQGHKIAIFVEDITTLANEIDFAFKNNTKALMGHTETTVEVIKNLMMLAKDGGAGKHTTIFTTLDDSDMFDKMYVSSVYKVSKKFEL